MIPHFSGFGRVRVAAVGDGAKSEGIHAFQDYLMRKRQREEVGPRTRSGAATDTYCTIVWSKDPYTSAGSVLLPVSGVRSYSI